MNRPVRPTKARTVRGGRGLATTVSDVLALHEITTPRERRSPATFSTNGWFDHHHHHHNNTKHPSTKRGHPHEPPRARSSLATFRREVSYELTTFLIGCEDRAVINRDPLLSQARDF